MSDMPPYDGPFLEDLCPPERFASEAELDQYLSTPSRRLVQDLDTTEGDLMILGAGGKMGPTLARLARNALPSGRKVIAVARFSDPALRKDLERFGIETMVCDLLDRAALARLPMAPNIIFMAGHKFGAGQETALTWAMNSHVPALVGENFPQSRIVAFSTACVYPFVPVNGPGATEDSPLAPPGEYANSCVGRERLLQYFSQRHQSPGRLFRLSYAIDLRYGVLADVATKVWTDQPVDVTMGHVNVIWQGDANAQALRCLAHTTVPTSALNVSGPETLSIRYLAEEFGRRFDRPVRLTGTEAPTAWLVNTGQAEKLFGYPHIPISRLLDWTSDWIRREQRLYGKPTKFESRDGQY
ncbi:NAD-dependent epimerase/dehydratase family protein [Castellaniella sp.]|uniref:NAD-dependent epimerase/dehydratase family protein n=1 Tax=Castellaniella sp. TaxID=1955812 RepID=UPI00355DF3DE